MNAYGRVQSGGYAKGFCEDFVIFCLLKEN